MIMSGLSLQKMGGWITQLFQRTEALEAENADLKIQMDELKEIVHNMLMKHNPEYKKRKVIGTVDDFLGKRFGERRP